MDNNKIHKALFVNLRPLDMCNRLTGMRYPENIPEVQMCHSSVVNK